MSTTPREEAFHQLLAVIVLVNGLLAFFTLLLVTPAPYGRYSKERGWGPLINAKLAWFVMESPNLWVTFLVYCLCTPKTPLSWSTPNLPILTCYLVHYINRALVYPLQMKATSHAMPLSVMLLACLFCSINAYLQATFFLKLHSYPAEYTPQSWCFRLGLLLFSTGFLLNLQADGILRGLRRRRRKNNTGTGGGSYSIPRGGLFTYVSAANYSAEILEWIGYAVMARGAYPATLFALFTFLNLAPRAYRHHQFYKEKFRDKYPRDRKALIPFIF